MPLCFYCMKDPFYCTIEAFKPVFWSHFLVSHQLLLNFLLLFLHSFSFCIIINMVITEEMKYAMNEKKPDFVPDLPTCLLSLSSGCLYRNNNIAQHIIIDVSEFTVPHGKGDHIGGAVYFPVVPVNNLDLFIIDKKNTKFCFAAI